MFFCRVSKVRISSSVCYNLTVADQGGWYGFKVCRSRCLMGLAWQNKLQIRVLLTFLKTCLRLRKRVCMFVYVFV